MYPAVKQVNPIDDHILEIEFDNGESGMLDMKPYLDFGLFQQLHDLTIFNKVRVSFDTVEWDIGLDLDPEFVYEKCKIHTHVLK